VGEKEENLNFGAILELIDLSTEVKTYNKANEVGRGLKIVVFLTTTARRLFECYISRES